MKKYNFFVLLFVICVGSFVPNGVLALEINNKIYNNIDIDYRFFVDEEKRHEGKKKFRLYDKSNSLNFESEYNSETHEYSFNIKSENYVPYDDYGRRKFYGRGSALDDFPVYIKDYNAIAKFKNNLDMNDYILNNNINGLCMNDYDNYNIGGTSCVSRGFGIMDLCNYYDYIPMILENTISGEKKILFASFNLYSSFYYYGSMMCVDKSIIDEKQYNLYYAGIYLYNHLNLSENDLYMLDSVHGLSFKKNIEFMRNAVYDYSDELWEEFNSGPIASSEISFENSSVVRNNVGSNSLDEPSIIRFNKVDNSASNSIISKISNPKTFNNGILIIIFSIIIVIGSSVLIINKKKNNGDV